MFANQSMELTKLPKKPTAGAADAKHAPAASVDQLPVAVPLMLKDFKIDLQLPVYRIRFPRFINFAASMARSAYTSQADAKKELPLSRFWKQPKTLLELCVQTIAGQLLQDGTRDIPEDVPDQLRDLIDQSLEEAGKVLEHEKWADEVSKTNREEFLTFVSSLNSQKSVFNFRL